MGAHSAHSGRFGCPLGAGLLEQAHLCSRSASFADSRLPLNRPQPRKLSQLASPQRYVRIHCMYIALAILRCASLFC